MPIAMHRGPGCKFQTDNHALLFEDTILLSLFYKNRVILRGMRSPKKILPAGKTMHSKKKTCDTKKYGASFSCFMCVQHASFFSEQFCWTGSLDYG